MADRRYTAAGLVAVLIAGAGAGYVLSSSCSDAIAVLVAGQTQCLNTGDAFRDAADAPEMILVAPADGALETPDQAAFAIGRLEVSFDEWDACAKDGGCASDKPLAHGWGGERTPAINLAAEDVTAYVGWLSARTGEAYRLATDDDWRRAKGADLGHHEGIVWEWAGECPPDGGNGTSGDAQTCLRRINRDDEDAAAYRYDAGSPIARNVSGFRLAREITR